MLPEHVLLHHLGAGLGAMYPSPIPYDNTCAGCQGDQSKQDGMRPGLEIRLSMKEPIPPVRLQRYGRFNAPQMTTLKAGGERLLPWF